MDKNHAIRILDSDPNNLQALAVLVPEALAQKNWNVALNLLSRRVRLKKTVEDFKYLAYVSSQLRLPRTTAIYLIAAKGCGDGAASLRQTASEEWLKLRQNLLNSSSQVAELYSQLDASASLTESLLKRLIEIPDPKARAPLYEEVLSEGAPVAWMLYYASDMIQLNRLQLALDAATAALLAEDISLGNLANLSAAFIAKRDPAELTPVAQAAVNIYPKDAAAWINLGGAFDVMKRPWEAIRACDTALTLDHQNASALNNLGNAWKNAGDSAKAADAYRRALNILNWEDRKILSNYLLSLQYTDTYTAEEKAAEHHKYGELFPIKKPVPRRQGVSKSGSLKIGFVSADFMSHSCSYFLTPLWRRLKARGISITAYDNATHQDNVTTLMASLADHWCSISETADQDLLEQISRDEIDVLIDPAGHTSKNRLGVFGLQAAPVQLTWLGHPNTTGLTQMDFRVTDEICDPPGVDSLYTETLYRMPLQTFGVYEPLVNKPGLAESTEYAVQGPPVSKNRYITFGSCNNIAKINDKVISTWCRILHAVPNSRLLLESPGLNQREFRKALEARFDASGMDVSRLQLCERDYRKQYLIYNEIDICLDPFPCNGGTTSFDLLWMGAPLVTLRGDIFVSRMGTMLLTHLQRQAWIANDLDHYVEIATALAQSEEALASARLGQRQMMTNSALMNAEAFGDQFADLLWSLAYTGEPPVATQS